MKSSAKLLGSRIVGAVHDASRAAGSTIIRNTPIPGLIEVQGVAKQLVDSLEDMDDYKHRCQVLSKRIAAIMKLLEPHNQAVINSELQFFYNKLTTCQKQLSRLDSKRGLSNALRISRQLEVIERLEKEIDSSLQDMMLALLVERLSEPRETVVYQPPPQPPKEPSPERLHYPKIKRCKLSINSLIRRSQADTKLGSIARSLARGTYRNQEVLVVQYSSKSQSSQVHNAFRGAIKAVIQEQHPNVLRFMGASDEGSSSENHYLVFDAGSTISRQSYVHALRSVHDAFQFLTGVKDGMEFLLEHGIQTWSDIHISAAGQPVVCPPYWDSVELWEKSNHDVFSSLTGTTEPADFPLSTLSEILNTSCDRWPEFETAVRSHPTKLRDYHLMQIADELNLAMPPFLLVYSGSLPEFIISVGSVGAPDWLGAGFPEDCFHGSMTGWMSVSSLWTCTGWDALQTCQLEYWATGRKVVPREEDAHKKSSYSSGGPSQESLGVLDPLGSSSDGWLSYGCFESSEWFGVGYELTISDSTLFESSWKRFTETRVPSMAHLVDEEQDLHVVRHITVRIHCKPKKMHGFLPLYFHRRPSSMFNTEHYWGFLSDSPDPDVAPCHLVKAIQVEYSVHVNTVRANDGWTYRAEQCFESIVSRTPGAFNF